ncbi:MAG: Holliday junction resolvase RuvX [Bacteroidales bacterium]
MSRIMAFDVGKKRIGIAVTDPLRIIATALATIDTPSVWKFLAGYLANEEVESFVVGWPLQMNNQPSEASKFIAGFIDKLRKTYPDKKIDLTDERFTSRIAQDAILEGGVKKMKRRDKGLTDQVSAVIILQSWMEKESIQKTRE